MKRFCTRISLLLLGSFFAVSALAHHSFSMFKHDTEVIIEGTVDSWAFNNPHSWLYINAVNEDGEEELWSFEAAAPPQLISRGITGRSFEPGDRVIVMFSPLVDGRSGGAICWVRMEDGSYIAPADGGCRARGDRISRWETWMEQGFTSNKEAEAAAL